MNPDVSAYFDKLNQAWQVDVCQQLRQVIHAAAPDVTERLQYGKPHFLHNGSYLAVIGPAKGWVSFTLFKAAGLENELFEPSDVTDRKTIKYKPGQTVDTDALSKLVAAAATAP
ncbi:MAG: DUF1801 domain-containing protein [Anaerolineae bacterium]|jgi:hypothetical protein|nr:DUF1801 domain-containing protein [Anaerolineae bacterium]